jgi:hypothetical protein
LADAQSIRSLLQASARTFDASATLRAAARRSARRGFQGGAEWMAVALAEIRGQPVSPLRPGATILGVLKYGAATGVAALAVLVLWRFGHLRWAPCALVLFYLVESQGAFLFPAFVDGAVRPWAQAQRCLRAAGGTWVVTSKVMVLAAVMLFGGGVGQGFLRSWCIGCLAILLWYEEVRR